MTWLWKAVGATVGAALGGPIGAGVGVALGHAVDYAAQETQQDTSTPQTTILMAIGCYLARFACDVGSLNQREKELIANICLELTEEKTLTATEIIDRLAIWSEFEGVFAEIVQLAQQVAEFRSNLLSLAWRVAARDNEISDNELGWIYRFNQVCGGSEEDLLFTSIPYLRREAAGDVEAQAREILGVGPNATAAEISKRFRELSITYHPDRHVNAASVLKQLAAEKFAKIVQAVEILEKANQPNLFGRNVDRRGISVATSKGIVRCFFCDQKCGLPSKAHFSNVRCPKCQSLLLFDEELANAFIEQISR